MLAIGDAEKDSLIEACQRNAWLKHGGIPWEDDPYLEDYPYEFSRAESIEALKGFFEHGNWALRQGVLFGDLAFINQINGGDEWWVLKNLGEGSWLDFESMNMGAIAKDSSDFIRNVAGMQLATEDECRTKEYCAPRTEMIWQGDAFPFDGEGYVIASDGDFTIAVNASRIGHMLQITGPDGSFMPEHSSEDSTLLQTIKAQVEAACEYAKDQSLTRLNERAQDAIRASENQRSAERFIDNTKRAER